MLRFAKICSLSEFDKSDEEIGEMTNIQIGGCIIVLKAAGGKMCYRFTTYQDARRVRLVDGLDI